MAPPSTVKILVSGGAGSGKSTLISSLSEIGPLTAEATLGPGGRAAQVTLQVETPGRLAPADTGAIDLSAGGEPGEEIVALDFGRVTIDGGIIMYFFGTPEENQFGTLWHDIARGAIGGVVMVDPNRIVECSGALRHYARLGLPCVVAVNQFEGRVAVPLDYVRELVDIAPDVPVVPVDARDRSSVKAVVLRLLGLVLADAQGRPRGSLG